MAKESMPSHLFEQLLSRINQETANTNKKLEILYGSRGYFSAHQAASIIYAFGIPSDKVRAIQIMEPRLCKMSCSEARDVIGALSIHNDKIKALECIKRVLSDGQSQLGIEQLLSAFPFEADKMKAAAILHTVRSDVDNAVPAGGHQGYAALGGLYTQCRPMVPHLYGSIEQQQLERPGYGSIQLPVEARSGVLPSIYTGHPSYAFPPGRDYATDRGYPGNPSASSFQKEPTETGFYPSGAPPLGQHQGCPAPTGFQGLQSY